MSCECVRPMTNRSGTILAEKKCIISSHIIENFIALYSLLSDLSQFSSVLSHLTL